MAKYKNYVFEERRVARFKALNFEEAKKWCLALYGPNPHAGPCMQVEDKNLVEEETGTEENL